MHASLITNEFYLNLNFKNKHHSKTKNFWFHLEFKKIYKNVRFRLFIYS